MKFKQICIYVCMYSMQVKYLKPSQNSQSNGLQFVCLMGTHANELQIPLITIQYVQKSHLFTESLPSIPTFPPPQVRPKSCQKTAEDYWFKPGPPRGRISQTGKPYPRSSRLPSMWRSSSSTLNPSQSTELFTLSLRKRPSTFRRKLD